MDWVADHDEYGESYVDVEVIIHGFKLALDLD